MAVKIIGSILILVALYMGVKQGWAMLSAKPQMLEMFGKWHIGKTWVAVIGAATLLGGVLILFPRTFLLGNFLSAAVILLIICLQLWIRDLKGAAVEVPFLLLSFLIIYLQHPLAK
ncbi:hypothetical protein EGT74_12015 [Chitinophaga lutea]|uniref:DoxX family protein n=1 Tax=Chitinophaga lutea TaxID=2488634 RepID=A0A3N4QRI9_9BACT|nr:DoxX family protein [Chitinophaga lutea]RPE14194.1 hypothetical protein EGT74_12015 [Chitinophaga lutea]